MDLNCLNKNIVLFGAGEGSEEVLAKFPKLSVKFIVDNNQKKWGTKHLGYDVKSPGELIRYDKKMLSIVVCSRLYYFEIIEQLKEMGFELNTHIINGYWLNEQANLIRKKFKDKHKNERVFLIGNGPSLTTEDLDKLKNEVTFATNKIYLAYESTEWRPTYYFVEDYLVAQNITKEISELPMDKFIVWDNKKYFDEKNIHSPNTYWVNYISLYRYDDKYRFSKNIEDFFHGGYTVMYFMMQVAYYMGFKEIYLLGVDFSFELPKQLPKEAISITSKTVTENIELVNSEEVNHFHPDYRVKGEKWTYPDLQKQYEAFNWAKQFFEKNKVTIANCSRKTKLDVFEIRNLDEIL